MVMYMVMRKENKTYYCFRRDDERILRHVPGAIDFAVVVDTLNDFNLTLVSRFVTARFFCTVKIGRQRNNVN